MKTISLKKVSAVAVASLGFGLLSVVPVNAANVANKANLFRGTSGTTTTAVSVAVGSAATVDLNYVNEAGAQNDTTTLTAALTQGPSGTAAITASSFSDVGTLTNGPATGSAEVRTMTAGAAGAVSGVQRFSYTPTRPGAHIITITLGGSATTSIVTNGSLTHVITVYAGYAVDAANPRNATVTQGVNTSTGWSTTAGGVGTVRFQNYPSAGTTDVRHFISVSGGTIIGVTNNATAADNRLNKSAASTTNDFNLTNGSNFASGVDFYVGSAATAADTIDVQVQAAAVGGNVTVTDTYYDASTGAATVFATAVLTVGAASAVSAATSTEILGATTTTPATDDTINASAAVGTQVANVAITLLDQYSVAAFGQTLSASITGPGLIDIVTSGAGLGLAKFDSLTLAANANTAVIRISGDGSGGVATLRILAGTTLLATKTLTFFGTATTVSAKVIEPHIQVGTATAVIEVSAKDSAGQFAQGTFSAKSSDQSVVASTSGLTCTQVTSANFSSYTKFAIGSYACDVTGIATGTTKLSINWDSLVTNTNTVVDIRVTKSVAATVTLTTDKATYAPGELVTLTFTATDSDGHLIGKGASTIDWLGADSFASSSSAAVKAAGTDLTNAAFNLSAGKRTTQYYAPGTPGAVTYSATLSADAAVPAALRGGTLTAKATVTDSSAAIITQIDALNAKIVALNALIAKIMKRLGVR